MTKKNILFINGIADDGKVRVTSITKNNGMHFQLNGNANIADFIDTDLISPFVTTFDLDAKQDLASKPGIHAVFNQISDADSHKIALGKTEILYTLLSEKLPFFNTPANVRKTTRDSIYQLLQGIDKLHVPKTVRLQPKSPPDVYDVIEKEGFEYPVIFRQAGDHNAINTILIKDKTELLYTFPLDGRDYYLTQFIETVEKEIYAKYRLVVIDGKVFIRHVFFSEDKIVTNRKFMEKNPEFQKKEENIFQIFDKQIKPKIQLTINEIHNKLGLDYFGIDCTLDEAFNLSLFEVNANMNILANYSGQKNKHLTQKVQLIRNALTAMINERSHNEFQH